MSASKDMIEKTEKAKKFLYRYNMEIVDANRRQQTCYLPPKYSISARYADDELYQSMYYETETLFTIQVPESKLESLIDFYDRAEDAIRHTGSMDMFNHFLQKQNDEKSFREKHPAVQKAYEQYQMLYKLARSGKD
jgi:hypothetical protein